MFPSVRGASTGKLTPSSVAAGGSEKVAPQAFPWRANNIKTSPSPLRLGGLAHDAGDGGAGLANSSLSGGLRLTKSTMVGSSQPQPLSSLVGGRSPMSCVNLSSASSVWSARHTADGARGGGAANKKAPGNHDHKWTNM
mmetsp:Transcript_12637/g.23327  ORF Transcript_12637/g.23327 Transcript_12637/m.23327 type:complete len:139 (-) Transcript_12637:120-536(-)